MTGNRKLYEDKLKAQLGEWNAQIDVLKAKADKAQINAKIEYHKVIENLQSKETVARAKLKELRLSGDDAWEDIKIGAVKVWDDIEKTFQDIKSKF